MKFPQHIVEMFHLLANDSNTLRDPLHDALIEEGLPVTAAWYLIGKNNRGLALAAWFSKAKNNPWNTSTGGMYYHADTIGPVVRELMAKGIQVPEFLEGHLLKEDYGHFPAAHT